MEVCFRLSSALCGMLLERGPAALALAKLRPHALPDAVKRLEQPSHFDVPETTNNVTMDKGGRMIRCLKLSTTQSLA
eukprot:1328685-Amphidinium_carterae.2